MEQTMEVRIPNKPAPGKAGRAILFHLDGHWPGLPEPDR
jgi:hypothetical protein